MNQFQSVSQSSVIALLLALGFGLPAHANKVVKNTISSSPLEKDVSVRVMSTNGETWNSVDGQDTTLIMLDGNFTCQFGWDNPGKFYKFDYSYEDFERVTAATPSPYDPSQKVAAGFRYKPSAEGFDARKVCTDETDKLLKQFPSLSKSEVMAQTRTFLINDASKGSFRAVCEKTGIGFDGSQTKEISLDVEVICEGSEAAQNKLPKAPIEPVEMSFVDLVTDAKFYAKEPEQVGKCPMNVELIGWMKFSRPGTVRYRYVGSNGRTSPTITLTAEKAGRQLTRRWNTMLKAPEPGSERASYAGQETSDVLKGSYRLEFVEPAGLPSLTANYSAVCTQEMSVTLPETEEDGRLLRKRPGRTKYGDTPSDSDN